MKFETQWNVGDRVWAVECHSRLALWAIVKCQTCNGEGGAKIPGTEMQFECKECLGAGEVSVEGPDLVWANSGRITYISVSVREHAPKPQVTYEFCGDRKGNPAGYRETTRYVFATEEEACKCADAMNARAEVAFDRELAGRTVLRSNLTLPAKV